MTFDKKYQNPLFIISDDTRAVITLKDKREPRKYIGNNNQKKQITVYQIDNGILKDGEKCDFGLYLPDQNELFLIELKGGDFTKALSQIHSTINVLLVKACVDTSKVHARIVLSRVRVPNIKSAAEIKLLKLLKELNGTLKKESQVMVENL